MNLEQMPVIAVANDSNLGNCDHEDEWVGLDQTTSAYEEGGMVGAVGEYAAGVEDGGSHTRRRC
jgi:hypothetical protein